MKKVECKKIKDFLNKNLGNIEFLYESKMKKLNEKGFFERIEWDFVDLLKSDYMQKSLKKYLEALKELERKGELKGEDILEFWIERLESKLIGNGLHSPRYSNNSSGAISGPAKMVYLDGDIEILRIFKTLK